MESVPLGDSDGNGDPQVTSTSWSELWPKKLPRGVNRRRDLPQASVSTMVKREGHIEVTFSLKCGAVDMIGDGACI